MGQQANFLQAKMSITTIGKALKINKGNNKKQLQNIHQAKLQNVQAQVKARTCHLIPDRPPSIRGRPPHVMTGEANWIGGCTRTRPRRSGEIARLSPSLLAFTVCGREEGFGTTGNGKCTVQIDCSLVSKSLMHIFKPRPGLTIAIS